jgi:hypothetical protein
MPPFLILALPRSRTKWLASFLSYEPWHCGWDELMHMRTLADVQTWWKQPHIGSVETAAAHFWRLIPPEVRVVTVRRPVRDVLASLMHAVPGLDRHALADLLHAADRKLDQIEARRPGVLSFRYDSLTYEACCARLFEHCLGLPHDAGWWAAWNAQHVSGNLRAQIRYCQAYLPQIQKLQKAAKQEMLAGLDKRRSKRLPLDGFVFQEEPFDQWLHDAQSLFRDHLAQTDQDADGYALKNLPLGRQLDMAGALQIITARQNGRLFGHVLATIGPSPDQRDALIAHLMLPFSSRYFPGLGRRLHSVAIEHLRAKGISQVLGRAGIRGDGPRLGSMYRRLGFADEGTLHSLDLH